MQGVPVELSAQVCWACMSLMLLRAGLLVKLRAFRARKLMLLRLGVLPCLKTASTYSAILVSHLLVSSCDCVPGLCAYVGQGSLMVNQLSSDKKYTVAMTFHHLHGAKRTDVCHCGVSCWTKVITLS